MQAQIKYVPGHELGRLLQPINWDVFELTFFVGAWYICRVSSGIFFISTLIPPPYFSVFLSNYFLLLLLPKWCWMSSHRMRGYPSSGGWLRIFGSDAFLFKDVPRASSCGHNFVSKEKSLEATPGPVWKHEASSTHTLRMDSTFKAGIYCIQQLCSCSFHVPWEWCRFVLMFSDLIRLSVEVQGVLATSVQEFRTEPGNTTN